MSKSVRWVLPLGLIVGRQEQMLRCRWAFRAALLCLRRGSCSAAPADSCHREAAQYGQILNSSLSLSLSRKAKEWKIRKQNKTKKTSPDFELSVIKSYFYKNLLQFRQNICESDLRGGHQDGICGLDFPLKFHLIWFHLIQFESNPFHSMAF